MTELLRLQLHAVLHGLPRQELAEFDARGAQTSVVIDADPYVVVMQTVVRLKPGATPEPDDLRAFVRRLRGATGG